MRPLRRTRGYSRIKECTSFWTWVWSEWNFVNSAGERQEGYRIFGHEFDWFYEIPMGELRF